MRLGMSVVVAVAIALVAAPGALAANELTIGCSPSCAVPVGTSVTFTASLVADGTKPSTANWDFNGDGLYDEASGNPVQESFDKPGSYTIEAETSLNCKPACTGEQKLTVVGPPISVTGDASVAGLSATLTGTVDPEGNQVTDCHFEYGPTLTYGGSAPCAKNPGAGNGAIPVSATVSGLTAGTTFHYRLVASNEVTSGQGDDRVFSTAPRGFTVGVSGPTGALRVGALVHVTARATPAPGRHIVAYLWSLRNPRHVDLDTGTRPFISDQVGGGTQRVWVRAEDSAGAVTPSPAEYTVTRPQAPTGCAAGLTPPVTFGWLRITAPDCIRHVAATAQAPESYVIDVPSDGIDLNGLNVYCPTSGCTLTIIGSFGPLPLPGSDTSYYLSSNGPLGLRMLNTPDGVIELGSVPRISFFWIAMRGQLVRSFLSVRLTSGQTLAGTPLTGVGQVALTAPGADGLPGIRLTVETTTTLLGSNVSVPVTMNGDSETEIQSAGSDWSIPLDGLNIPPLFWINHGSISYTPADPRVGGGGTYQGHVEASFYLVNWDVGADLVFHLDAGRFVFDSGGFSLDHTPDGGPDSTSVSSLAPIGLDHLDAHLQVNPFLDIGGGLTVTAGPFHIGGGFEFAAAHTDPGTGAAVPFQLSATGTIPIPIPAANLTVGILVTGDPMPGFGISGELSVDWGVATIDGRLYGYFAGGSRLNFEFGGSVGLKVLGIDMAGGAGFVNNDWIAGCGHVLFLSAWAVHSLHGAGDNSGLGGCENIAPFSIAPELAHLSGVRAGIAGGTGWRIHVPKRLEWANLQLKSSATPPRVRIVGPGIDYTTTGHDGLQHAGEVYVLTKASVGVTLLGLHFPRPGTYTLTPAGGVRGAADGPEPRITVQQSFSTASAITAGVIGRGDARRLSYTVTGPSGQRVTFYERGAQGEAPIGTVVNGHGVLPFHPGQFGGRARTIVAFAAVDGIPRGSQVVARYTAPPLDHVGKPQELRIVYRAGRADALVRWRRVAGAPNYVVILHTSDGRNVSFVVNGLSLEIPAIAPSERLTVMVQARTILGTRGAAARATLHVPRQTRPSRP
jgi:hypothetical protein